MILNETFFSSGRLSIRLQFATVVAQTLLAVAGLAAPVYSADLDIQALRDIAAMENAKAVVKLEPLVKGDYAENAEAQFYYGRCLFNLQRYSAAKVALEKSLSLGLEGWCEDVAKSDLVIINSGPSGSSSSSSRGGLRGYIGLELDRNIVHAVAPNSPAEQARILPGDTILAVNKVSVVSMSPKDILLRLSGVVGSTINLTILRAGKTYSSRVTHAYASLGDNASHVFEKPLQSTPGGSGRAAAGVSKGTAGVAANISASDQALVKVFRHTSDTDAIKAQVMAAISHIPQNIKDSFASAGVTMLIAPTVLDARPDLANQKPRGYDNGGGGYDNCGGMYMPSEKTIYVAEKYGIQSQPFKFNRRAYETTLHESGHAFDHLKYDQTRTDLSKTEEFLAIYKKESDSLSNSNRSGVTYFLQADGAGSGELFAELFVAACDPASRDEYGVVKAFPRTFEYLKKIIQNAMP